MGNGLDLQFKERIVPCDLHYVRSHRRALGSAAPPPELGRDGIMVTFFLQSSRWAACAGSMLPPISNCARSHVLHSCL